MMQVLMDTGPWVALVDRSEGKHRQCVQWLQDFKGEIYSTEAVLTEVLCLLNFSSAAQAAALDFILTGAIILAPSTIDSLTTIESLMEKYKNLPMDYADATLVSLAHDLSINNIVTFDRKHFGIYRLFKSQTFTAWP
jgi:uncharacterized protein